MPLNWSLGRDIASVAKANHTILKSNLKKLELGVKKHIEEEKKILKNKNKK